ncbi:MAG: class I SAM-dependent methyltransferase [Candidatus Eisenbacteria sp.]|nr:class I SAM-dependent methyltransferase [Candidatus Eisenbacteria bacterium]
MIATQGAKLQREGEGYPVRGSSSRRPADGVSGKEGGEPLTSVQRNDTRVGLGDSGTAKRLRLIEIDRDPSSYVDPNGYVFQYDGGYYRAIRVEQTPFYKSLFTDGTIDALVAEHHLVPSSITGLAIEDADLGLVLKHERISPTSYCVEWCPAMLLDAAAVTIDLLSALLDRGAILQDAYPWNILFRGTQPFFVDLTSIVEIQTPVIWPAYDQFQAFFLRPLALCAQGHGAVARALLHDNIAGISRKAFVQCSTFAYKLTHPLDGFGLWVDQRIQSTPALKTRLRQAANRAPITVDRTVRARFFGTLRRKLKAFRFDVHPDVWAPYYEQIAPDVDKEAKLKAVSALIDRLHPETICDLGCNTGVFSVLAARTGARIIAIDSSETCISRLYARAKADSLSITPLLSDVLCPTPAFGFMSAQYPSLIERATSDVVLCLALMHHLHITGRQSFDRIARLMSALAKKDLIFEFVAMDDANNDLLGAGREIDYSLDDVQRELHRYFPQIEALPSDRATRKILLCSK